MQTMTLPRPTAGQGRWNELWRQSSAHPRLAELTHWLEERQWQRHKVQHQVMGIHPAALSAYDLGPLLRNRRARSEAQAELNRATGAWAASCQATAQGDPRAALEWLVLKEMAWHEAAHLLMSTQLGYRSAARWNGPAHARLSATTEILGAPALHQALIALAPLGIDITGLGLRTAPSPEDLAVAGQAFEQLLGSAWQHPHVAEDWKKKLLVLQFEWRRQQAEPLAQLASLLLESEQVEVQSPWPSAWMKGSSALRNRAAELGQALWQPSS